VLFLRRIIGILLACPDDLAVLLVAKAMLPGTISEKNSFGPKFLAIQPEPCYHLLLDLALVGVMW